jgi:hypothetical protein
MWGEGDSERGTVSREDKGGWMWTMYVLQIYEYGTLKPETVKSFYEGEWGKKLVMEGNELNQVQYMYLWKYYKETPCIMLMQIIMFCQKVNEFERRITGERERLIKVHLYAWMKNS